MYTSIYNPYVPQEVFLAHHGIMGQRWGKKNGPPYPLSAGAHSASEKKAGWRKSLAAAGRGTVKVAKAVGKGTVATAKFVNKAAVRTHIKPRILMSEKEMTDSIARMRLSKQYKRALKGKFINVEEAERNKGKGAVSQLMGAIGKEVIIPTTTGLLRYAVAEKLGGKAEGEKVTSLKETLFNSKGGIGFRNDYFYDKNGNPVYREKGKKNGNGDGNKEGKNKKQNKEQNETFEEPKETVKTSSSEPKQNKGTPSKKQSSTNSKDSMSEWIKTLSNAKPINDVMRTNVSSVPKSSASKNTSMNDWIKTLSNTKSINDSGKARSDYIDKSAFDYSGSQYSRSNMSDWINRLGYTDKVSNTAKSPLTSLNSNSIERWADRLSNTPTMNKSINDVDTTYYGDWLKKLSRTSSVSHSEIK